MEESGKKEDTVESGEPGPTLSSTTDNTMNDTQPGETGTEKSSEQEEGEEGTARSLIRRFSNRNIPRPGSPPTQQQEQTRSPLTRSKSEKVGAIVRRFSAGSRRRPPTAGAPVTEETELPNIELDDEQDSGMVSFVPDSPSTFSPIIVAVVFHTNLP
jgi:hypothetical protein